MQTYTLSESSKISKHSKEANVFVLRDKRPEAGRHFNLMHKGLGHMLGNLKKKGHELTIREEEHLRYMLEEVISAKKALDKENRRENNR